MQKATERTVLFFDARIQSSSRNYKSLEPLSASKIVHIWEKLMEGGLDPRSCQKGTVTYYLSALRINNARKTCTFLINVANQNLADPAFAKPKTRELRVVAKERDEGQAYSAHVVMHLVPTEDDPHAYLTLIEMAPGLSSGQVQRFLNYLLRAARSAYPDEFLYPSPDGSMDKDGNPKMISRRHAITLRGHVSDSLIHDLRTGTLNSIELITESTKNTGWDDQGYVREKVKTVRLKPVQKDSLSDNYETLKQLFKRATKTKYE